MYTPASVSDPQFVVAPQEIAHVPALGSAAQRQGRAAGQVDQVGPVAYGAYRQAPIFRRVQGGELQGIAHVRRKGDPQGLEAVVGGAVAEEFPLRC